MASPQGTGTAWLTATLISARGCGGDVGVRTTDVAVGGGVGELVGGTLVGVGEVIGLDVGELVGTLVSVALGDGGTLVGVFVGVSAGHVAVGLGVDVGLLVTVTVGDGVLVWVGEAEMQAS